MLFKKKNKEHIGKVFIGEEIVPIFAGRGGEANRELMIVRDVTKNSIVKVNSFDFLEKRFSKHHDISKIKPITQNDKPVYFTRKGNLKLKSIDINFEKDGYRKGQLYSFDNMGYLRNKHYIEKVYLVSDQYVFFKDMDTKLISIKSYDELVRIQPSIVS